MRLNVEKVRLFPEAVELRYTCMDAQRNSVKHVDASVPYERSSTVSALIKDWRGHSDSVATSRWTVNRKTPAKSA